MEKKIKFACDYCSNRRCKKCRREDIFWQYAQQHKPPTAPEQEIILKRRLSERLYTVLYLPENNPRADDDDKDDGIGDVALNPSLMKPHKYPYWKQLMTFRYNDNHTVMFFDGFHHLSPTKRDVFDAQYYERDVAKWERKRYCSVKHSYDHLKCLTVGDIVVANEVSKASNTKDVHREMLRLHDIKASMFPIHVRKQNMLVSARLRFFMNVNARRILRNTHPLKLVYVDDSAESSELFALGLGLDFYDDDLLDCANWKGANAYGDILMQVRDELIEEKSLTPAEEKRIDWSTAHHARFTANDANKTDQVEE